jgi:hypothetical protein
MSWFGDGTEVSFNQLELDSQEAVELFVEGGEVAVRYNERFRDMMEDEEKR